MLSRLAVALFWLLHWLPLPVLARLGEATGELLYRFAGVRRHIVRVNLELCFPDLDRAARRRLARAHFRAAGRSLLERSLLWFASAARLERLIRLDGERHVRGLLARGRPSILLAPHFVGLERGGTRLSRDFDRVCIYARQ
jgi:KDO2-lipid IV(A) lauroyltransferase